MGFVGLSLGCLCQFTPISANAMEGYKFHGILQKNGFVENKQIQDLTVLQADEYSEYLARRFQIDKEKKAISALRILHGMAKFSSIRDKIEKKLQEMSYLKPKPKPQPANPQGSKKTAPKTYLTLKYFYGVLRANKLIPNNQIPNLNNDELKTYIDYLLLKRKYDSTNQEVISALKAIMKLPQYKQFIGTKEEIFLNAPTGTNGSNGLNGLNDQLFYGYLQKGDIIPMEVIKQLNREQLDIYIDYLRLRYKYFRIEDGDQRDNARTLAAEKYLHNILLIRAAKRTIY